MGTGVVGSGPFPLFPRVPPEPVRGCWTSWSHRNRRYKSYAWQWTIHGLTCAARRAYLSYHRHPDNAYEWRSGRSPTGRNQVQWTPAPNGTPLLFELGLGPSEVPGRRWGRRPWSLVRSGLCSQVTYPCCVISERGDPLSLPPVRVDLSLLFQVSEGLEEDLPDRVHGPVDFGTGKTPISHPSIHSRAVSRLPEVSRLEGTLFRVSRRRFFFRRTTRDAEEIEDDCVVEVRRVRVDRRGSEW